MAKQEEQEYYWVGIGASAGGLEAIQKLCHALPQNANMIYIVAQHLSPNHESMLTELLERSVSLTAQTIVDGLHPKPSTIYVTPPQFDVVLQGSQLHLQRVQDSAIPKPSVNKLFSSLAEEKGERAVGVILSGTGTDGANGIKMIRACGGLTYVQEKEDAAYDGMPAAAIATDCVDYTLKADAIGEHLATLSSQLPDTIREKLAHDETKDHFAELINIVRERCGVSFKQYKKATLHRRIERRMIATGISDFKKYVEFVKETTEEVFLLYKDILISVTNFFRDGNAFMQLEGAIHDILKNKKNSDPIRFWVVGCATGEEAYSLAILLSEAVSRSAAKNDHNYQIFATDVDTDALAIARKGVYSEASMVNVPQEYKTKYFTRRSGHYEVVKELKNMVLFSGHNIVDDPPFMRVDLITCRNLLIYFEQELQKKVYGLFHYSLAAGGYLFLGKSESTTQVTELFRPIKSKERIFQKRSVTASNPHRYFLSGRSTVQEPKKSLPEPTKVPSLPETFVEQLGEASVLISDNLDIEHVYGDAGPYLRLAKGKPSLNLAEIVIDSFRQELRPVIFKVLRTKSSAEGQERKVTIEGKVYIARLKVYPLQVDEGSERFLLVCFERLRKAKKGVSITDQGESGERIKELEDELSMAREHLQTVIEELETSNEELQSINEELQSSNEELQSSNEELETTNEELQSTNEELVTMNDELNSKTTALEQVSTMLENVKDSLVFPLLYSDRKGKIIKSNQAATKILSVSEDRDDYLGNITEGLQKYNLPSLVQSVTTSGNTEKRQLELNGAHYWLHVTPFKQSNQDIDGAILSFIDNTELEKQKHELLDSRKKAQEASIAKSEFLANVSHEIRTPLNAIVCVTEIFRLQIENTERREKMLDVLQNSTLSLKNLLDDLLDFAKLEAGQTSLEYTSFSLQNLVSKVVDTYSVEATRKKIQFVATLDESLPEHLLGDPLRIQQILVNLLSNALKFTEEGTVKLLVGGLESVEGFEVSLQVSDTGVGMTQKEVGKIFDKFTQADASISRRFGGTGLGLSIVRELVELMGGRISVESEKGKGSCFHVTLPLRVSQAPEGDQADLISPEDKAKLKDRKVLIIEDNKSNIFVLKAFLDELGCQYDVAHDGFEGVERIKNSDYFLVLLDLQMDAMDGFQFFEQFKLLRQEGTNKNCKVVALSAHVHKDIIERCEFVGMDGFLPKPIDMKKLNHTLIKHV